MNITSTPNSEPAFHKDLNMIAKVYILFYILSFIFIFSTYLYT